MLNLFEIAKRETRDDLPEGVRSFAVEPAWMYPEALADMLDAKDIAGSLSTALAQEITAIHADLTPEAIALALTPKEDTATWRDEDKQKRARMLNHARRWFTEKLHASINHKPLNVHILRDERFRN